MRRIRLIDLILILVPLILLGCEADKSEKDDKLQVKDDIKEINIFKRQETNDENSGLLTSFSNKEDIKTLRKIITSSTKIDGIVNVREPDYNIKIIYADDSEEELRLWIGQNGSPGSLMKAKDTHTLYNISQEMNSKMIELPKLK